MLRTMNTGSNPSPRWARIAQIAWIVTALLGLAFFAVEIQLSYQSPLPSTDYLTALRTFYMLAHLLIAGFLIFKRPNETFAVFVAYFLLLMGATFWTLSPNILEQPAFWQTPRAIANLLTSIALEIISKGALGQSAEPKHGASQLKKRQIIFRLLLVTDQ